MVHVHVQLSKMSDSLKKLFVSGTLAVKPAAKQYLVCFPWAGGGAAQYIRWNKIFPLDIEVFGVRLPGRETRLNEKPYTSVSDIAKDAAQLLAVNFADKPISLLGHSFGSRLALETAWALKTSHDIEPKMIFVSGSFAPGSEIGNAKLKERIPSELTDDNLLGYLRMLGGTPKAVMDNSEMMKLVLPPLRADLALLFQYSYNGAQVPPLSCPLYILDGKDDIEHHLHEWTSLTSGTSEVRLFPGGHFFLLDPNVQKSVNEYIIDKLITETGP